MQDIAHEAERRPSHCRHISEPKAPRILYGCAPSEAVRVAAERAEQAVDADGRKLRVDGLVFLAGVASFPVTWMEVRKEKTEAQRLRQWLGYLIRHLQKQYGSTLSYILLHSDETYPHVHWGVVPELEPDRRLRISSVHPGRAAYEKARAAGGTNLAGRQAYKAAMRKWLDDFHLAVYAPLGFARVGARRQRLSRREYKARQQADAALARTLAAKRELKERWRQEIRAEIVGEFSEEIEHWKRVCVDQRAQLATASEKLAELHGRIADLEARLHSPSPKSP